MVDVKEKYCRFPNHNTVMIPCKKMLTAVVRQRGVSISLDITASKRLVTEGLLTFKYGFTLIKKKEKCPHI